jgi:hypothetical protein
MRYTSLEEVKRRWAEAQNHHGLRGTPSRELQEPGSEAPRHNRSQSPEPSLLGILEQLVD